VSGFSRTFRSFTVRVPVVSAFRRTVFPEVLMRFRIWCAALALSAIALPASAQQRPLVTEDPEPIGAGRILIEGGLDLAHDYQNPASGLKGNLVSLPTIGLSFGLSSIARVKSALARLSSSLWK